MCRETISPISIQGQRVRCGKRTYYLPRNAPAKLRQAVQSAIDSGQLLDVELLNHYLIVGVYGSSGHQRQSVATKPYKQQDASEYYIYLGAYTWMCSKCGKKVIAVDKPKIICCV